MNYEKPLSLIELKFTGDAEDGFMKALKGLMELHEGVTFIDLFKFLYQSSLGPIHIFDVMDETQIKNWIRESLENAKPSDEPLIEDLFGKKWVRLNLGAYRKKHGNSIQRLYKVFMNAKAMKKDQLEDFEELLRKLVEGLKAGKIEAVTHEPQIMLLVEDFLREQRKKGYPPIHHSKIFMQKNDYAYLVISKLSMDELV
jgi:hypothetical protein